MDEISLYSTRDIIEEKFIKVTKIPTNCLNTLKFFASISIAFLWHYNDFVTRNFPFGYKFLWSYKKGFIFVELFFMLSGFGMFMGYGKR